MRVSVAMCTYNGERHLQRQLASIAAQSRLPDELIVNDDCSTDATVKLVEEFASVAPFSVDLTVNDHRLGVSRNFEAAIRRCRGDLVALCDQDDIWLPHRLELAEDRLEEQPDVGLTFSDAFLIDDAGRRTGNRLWGLVGFGTREQQRMRAEPFGQLMGRSIVSGCTLAFRADLADLILPFPAEETSSQMRVLHDRWISLVVAAASRVDVQAEPLVEYRIHNRQQVGIPNLQIRRLVPSSALRWRSAAVPTREHVARLRATIGLLEEVAGRLALLPAGARVDAEANVRAAIEHLRAREAFDEARAARLVGIAREVASGRYHRYSLGVASAFADAVRPRGARQPG